MLVRHEDPEFGEFIGPGVVPKFSDSPGSVRWSGPPEGSHNDEIFGALLELDEDELRQLHAEGIL